MTEPLDFDLLYDRDTDNITILQRTDLIESDNQLNLDITDDDCQASKVEIYFYITGDDDVDYDCDIWNMIDERFTLEIPKGIGLQTCFTEDKEGERSYYFETPPHIELGVIIRIPREELTELIKQHKDSNVTDLTNDEDDDLIVNLETTFEDGFTGDYPDIIWPDLDDIWKSLYMKLTGEDNVDEDSPLWEMICDTFIPQFPNNLHFTLESNGVSKKEINQLVKEHKQHKEK